MKSIVKRKKEKGWNENIIASEPSLTIESLRILKSIGVIEIVKDRTEHLICLTEDSRNTELIEDLMEFVMEFRY